MRLHKLILIFFVYITLSLQVKSNTMDSLLQALELLPDDTVKVMTLLELSREMMNEDLNFMFHYAQKAKQLSEKINYPNGIVRGMNSMGISFLMQGKTDTSFEMFEEAAKAAKKFGLWKLENMMMNNIGVSYYSRGDYTQAYIYHQNACEVARSKKDTLGVAMNLCSMGEDLAADNQHIRAIEVLVESRGLAEYLNHTYLKNLSYILIANSYLELKAYSEADKWLQEGMDGLEKNAENSDPSEQYIRSLFYNQKARLLDLQGKKELALAVAGQAEIIAREKNFSDVLSKNLTISASIYLKQNKFSQAITMASEALELSIESEALDDQKKNYHLLTTAYAAIQDYEIAYQTKTQYHAISDSLARLALERNIRDLDYPSIKYLKKKQKTRYLRQNRPKIRRC